MQQSAAELESLIKQKVLNRAAPPSGKVYRRGSIFKRSSVRDTFLNRSRFKNRFFSLNEERFAVATKIHRASRRGEPFANDTGGTINATRARAIGEMRAEVINSKRHAATLDRKDKLDRPFFASTAEEFRAKFKQNLADTIKENS